MIRTIAASFCLLLAVVAAGAPAGAAEPVDSTTSALSPALEKSAWIWSGRDAGTPPRRSIPVAACTTDCCCEFVEAGTRKNQCKSHDQCLEAGGICRNKTDAKCN